MSGGVIDEGGETNPASSPLARRLGLLILLSACVAGLVLLAAASPAPARGGGHHHRKHHKRHRRARVLLVGSYRGIKGGYKTVQAAVGAARPGDFVLVGPGVYHERDDHAHPASSSAADHGDFGGVLISKPNITVRGMNRGRVVIDGTLPHAGPACSSNPKYQDYGATGSDGSRLGRNGIVVYSQNNRASGVSVENLTVCNFLQGSGDSGNQIWWNGGDRTGKIGMGRFYGSYLSATTTFYNGEDTAASYGIFSNSVSGPGEWDHTYASNFNDSDYYIGACSQACNQVIDDAHAQFSALGYSGTNSGGRLVVKNSEFDHNQDGFDTNSQNNDDYYPPQDGACPGGGTSPITHTHSCWVFMHNYVHDNNNPNVPGAGAAAAGPVGTGMSVAGGRDDTIMDNRFVNNGAWGVIFVPYPDTESPPPLSHCQGGQANFASPAGTACYFDDWGNALVNNTFSHNGSFGNQTNGDFAELTTFPGKPQNCYHGNSAPDGSSPSSLQSTNGQCGKQATAPDPNPAFFAQVACDSEFFGPCPSGTAANYPRRTQIALHPLPHNLATMPKPCAGVPANPWCTPVRNHRHTSLGSCVAPKTSFSFTLSHPAGVRFVDVKVYVNGVLRRHLTGHDIARVTLGRVSLQRFTVRVVGTESNGNRVILSHVYRLCPAT